MKTLIVTLLLLVGTQATSVAQHTTLRQQLATIGNVHSGSIGISVRAIEDQDTLTVNNSHHYPMQSTFKFPLALYVLHKVDKGQLALDQKIHISKEELYRNTWSPLREKYPDGNIDITIAELLDYTVSKSDNNTCDILFKLVKGTYPTNKYIHKLGVKDIDIVATELQMGKGWGVQYTNWTTPSAMTDLLYQLYTGKCLSPGSTQFLMKLMTESANSDKRIKGLLPAGTIVAHKTGTSNTSTGGITAAVNDLGIITLPNGKHLAIAVYVSDTKEKSTEAEHVIAEIAKAVYDEYAGK
ncbi:hypothetical protein CJD36_017310 [Flavipsychrobacter stenotrophus]|uniref:Beta-lactamase n=1 Tax=Flavipsychrobacter stenotrophus TaxID=2077091 RepID=A0A2S7SS00_9BACT|nr:class A beta-lactamase, subclass A2 [Flavipsychrobacter stenotrophus]PQJ09689.1 hypothetical protein CJD36_017310 [Flavipsychrobacter stenotrophus]